MDRRGALQRIALAATGACAGVRASAEDGADADQAGPGAPLAEPRSGAGDAVLRRSDVVFMYEASAEAYAACGATVLAWGGEPTPASLKAAAGVAWHGSVGMVTEFARYYDRFPKTWQAGLCRNVHGQPLKVPWLTDHQHEGVPFWWCCTRQPQFREYLESRVTATLRAGASGLHVDDHLGSAGALFLGACFCERCVAGFREHLAGVDGATRAALGVGEPSSFDYGAVLRKWLAECLAGETRRVTGHPLWREWSVYQLRSAATYMQELRALAGRVAGRPVPVSANAGLLWPDHLADYQALDYFSAETDHDAASRRLNDRPLLAYRMADALGRPYAATASGQDWAFVKEQGVTGLVQGWIAAAYAAGHRLMAPHRQWCYTEAKGTHWYDGPREAYAPLFRFVRAQAALLDGHEPWADVAVLMPHQSWAADRERWLAITDALAAANVSYRLAIGSDEVVAHPLRAQDLAGIGVVLSPASGDLVPADRGVLDRARASVRQATRFVDSVEAALALTRPAVRVEGDAPVRVHPRVAEDDVVVHVLNRAYDPTRDAFTSMRAVRLQIDREHLGIDASVSGAAVVAPGAAAVDVPLRADGALALDLAGPWALVRVRRR